MNSLPSVNRPLASDLGVSNLRILKTFIFKYKGPAQRMCAPPTPPAPPPPPSPAYSKVTSGSCSSNGALPIKTVNECNQAAAEIGEADTSAEKVSDLRRPEGCYGLNGDIFFATNDANIGNGGDGSRFPICRAGALLLFLELRELTGD